MTVMGKAEIHLINIVFAMHNEELNNKVALAAVRERIARTPQKILRIRKREMQGKRKRECRLLRHKNACAIIVFV